MRLCNFRDKFVRESRASIGEIEESLFAVMERFEIIDCRCRQEKDFQSNEKAD